MEYHAYIKSQKWRRRREKYYKTHEKKCRACNSTRQIELHHKTYNRLGTERDADLVPLCAICHTDLHAWQRSSGVSLWRATEDYIRSCDGTPKVPKPKPRRKTNSKLSRDNFRKKRRRKRK